MEFDLTNILIQGGLFDDRVVYEDIVKESLEQLV